MWQILLATLTVWNIIPGQADSSAKPELTVRCAGCDSAGNEGIYAVEHIWKDGGSCEHTVDMYGGMHECMKTCLTQEADKCHAIIFWEIHEDGETINHQCTLIKCKTINGIVPPPEIEGSHKQGYWFDPDRRNKSLECVKKNSDLNKCIGSCLCRAEPSTEKPEPSSSTPLQPPTIHGRPTTRPTGPPANQTGGPIKGTPGPPTNDPGKILLVGGHFLVTGIGLPKHTEDSELDEGRNSGTRQMKVPYALKLNKSSKLSLKKRSSHPGDAFILDPITGSSCRMPNYPNLALGAFGGIQQYGAHEVPSICGGMYNADASCYRFNPAQDSWEKLNNVDRAQVHKGWTVVVNAYSAVAQLSKSWMWLIGGRIVSRNAIFNRTMFLYHDGLKVKQGPNLDQYLEGACATVLQTRDNSVMVAILGGWTGKKQSNSVYLFNCDLTAMPSCKKVGTSVMQVAKSYFGCGVMETPNGKKLLLAIIHSTDSSGSRTPRYESLDVTNITDTNYNATSWKFDVFAGSFQEKQSKEILKSTLVISKDAKVGYFVPDQSNVFYKVSCTTDANNLVPICKFDGFQVPKSITDSGKRKEYVALSVPSNHDFKCLDLISSKKLSSKIPEVHVTLS